MGWGVKIGGSRGAVYANIMNIIAYRGHSSQKDPKQFTAEEPSSGCDNGRKKENEGVTIFGQTV